MLRPCTWRVGLILERRRDGGAPPWRHRVRYSLVALSSLPLLVGSREDSTCACCGLAPVEGLTSWSVGVAAAHALALRPLIPPCCVLVYAADCRSLARLDVRASWACF